MIATWTHSFIDLSLWLVHAHTDLIDFERIQVNTTFMMS